MWLCLVLLACLAPWPGVWAETYSSTASVELLVAAQDMLLAELDLYVRQEEARLANIKRSLDRIRNETHVPLSRTTTNPSLESKKTYATSRYAGHPVNGLHVISRWAEVQEQGMLAQKRWGGVLQTLHQNLGISLPNTVDVQGSVDGLVRLQETYKLSTEDIASGFIQDAASDLPMAAEEFYAMGKAALKAGYFGLAVQWLEKALACRNGLTTVLTSDAMSDLATAYQLISDYSMAVSVLQQAHKRNPGNKEIADQLQSLRKLNATMRTSTGSKQGMVWSRPKTSTVTAYEALCRGQEARQKQEEVGGSRALECRLRTGRAPLVRYKEEVMHWDPYIVLFHDVITDIEANVLKLAAINNLRRAHVADDETEDGSSVSARRVSQVAWLWDRSSSPVIEKLSLRVSDLTGLETGLVHGKATAEPFQVLNYGIGGQYEPHVDYFDDLKAVNRFPEHVQNTGDRMATFMYYLGEVQAGGATVFPKINVRVPPTKNGAAFWYNMKRSGKMDNRTEHAGCPVLLGHKWVANKWVREYGQEFVRSCGLRKDSPQDQPGDPHPSGGTGPGGQAASLM